MNRYGRDALTAECDSRRKPQQSDGSGRHDAERRRGIRHPRHQRPTLDRRLCLLRLHSHVQNEDVLDLYNRVSWGTTVVVTR